MQQAKPALGDCRCGRKCVWVEYEGDKHDLCSHCDAATIKAIETGNIPQMYIIDEDHHVFGDLESVTPETPRPSTRELLESRRPRLPNARAILGAAAMGMLGAGMFSDDGDGDLDDSEPSDPQYDDAEKRAELDRVQAELTLSETREYHARLLYQQMVAAVLHTDIENGPNGRPYLASKQVDFAQLAQLAFAATDDFDVVATRERGET